MSVSPCNTAYRLFDGLLQRVASDGGGAQVRAALQHLRAVYDASPDMIFLHGDDGRILDMNDNALRCYGYTSADIARLTIADLSGSGYSAARVQKLLGQARRQSQVDFEWVARRRDGGEFPVEVRLRRVEGMSAEDDLSIVAIVRDISARRRAEHDLKQSVNLFENAFEYAAIGMALVAPEGRWLKVNPALCRLTGYSAREMLEFDFQSITHPDDLAADMALVRQLLAGEIDTYQMEKRYITKSGEVVWVLLSVSLVRDAANAPQFFISQMQDINDHKMAALRLHQERDFSEAVLNTIGSVVVVLDREGNIVEFNQAAQTLTGYVRDEVVGRPVWDLLLPPEQVGAVRGVFDRLTAGDFPSRYENHWLTRHGDRRLLAWSNTALVDEQDRVSYVIATGIDVTEKRAAEQALRASEERFRYAAQSTADLILEWHADIDQVIWSGDVDAVMGYPPGQCLRTGTDWMARIHPDDLAQVQAASEQAFATGKSIRTEYRIKDGRGQWRIWQARGVGVRNAEGNPLRFYGAVTDVTEQRAAESAVLRLGRLMEQSVTEIYVFRADTLQLTQVSRGAVENLGYSHDELLAMTPLDLQPAYSPAVFAELLAPLRRGETASVRLLTAHRRKDGSEYPVEVHVQLSSQEQPPVYLAVVEDITVRQSAEEGRLRALERLRALKDLERAILSARSSGEIANTALGQIQALIPAFQAGLYMFDTARGVARILARSGCYTAGHDPGTDVPLAEVLVDDLELLRQGQVLRLDDLLATAAGVALERRSPVEGMRSALVVPLLVHGRLFGCLSLLSPDVAAYDDRDVEIAREVATSIALAYQQTGLIDEIKRHADELEARVLARTQELARVNEDLQSEINIRVGAEAVLRDREKRFRQYYELGLIGIATASVDQRWHDFNDRLCEMLGYAPRALREMTWIDITHPDDVAADMAQYRRVLAGEIEGYSLDKRFLRRDGSIMHASVSMRCVRGADGAIEYFVKFVQDISERKLAEDHLRQTNEELAQANRDLESFSYSVSHDLRTPLRSIDGFSMVLLEEYGDRLDARGRGYFERIRRAAQTMGRLIDDMLRLSRIGRLPLQRETVDVTALSREILAEHRELAPERQVSMAVEADLSVRADPTLCRVLLENLIGNAWKFTGENPGARIEVGRASAGPDSYLYIKDNGVGFDMQYADKIFLPFQRLHQPQRFEGTGIGLATVARIVHRHGGRIWAEAELGVGATVCFALPDVADEVLSESSDE